MALYVKLRRKGNVARLPLSATRDPLPDCPFRATGNGQPATGDGKRETGNGVVLFLLRASAVGVENQNRIGCLHLEVRGGISDEAPALKPHH